MNKNRNVIRKITGMAFLLALTAILQYSASFIFKFSPVEINLGLIPIIIAAILYGPIEGMAVGILNGLLVIFNTGTEAFLVLNPVATIFVCLIKTSLAGFVSGLLYKLISKKNDLVASIIASLVVPIINTTIFFIGCLLFFVPLFSENVSKAIEAIFKMIFAVNTVIEILSISILCPIIYRIIVAIRSSIYKGELANGKN